jgi:hypothetical protein
MVHHADPTVDRGSKRETVIKHQKSPSVVTTYQVTGLALELSRLPDNTIGPDFEQNCQRAFDMLIKYHSLLLKTVQPENFNDSQE